MRERREAFASISDNDDDSDHITSYCPRCQEFGFLSELKERIYDRNKPIPFDHDAWMQCYRCGTIVAEVNAKRENEIVGVKDPENSYDYNKTIILPVYQDSLTRRKIKYNKINRIQSGNRNTRDPDVEAAKKKGHKVTNITEYNRY